MEPPVAFEADRVREEKIKIFRCIRSLPLDRLDEYLVVGHYEARLLIERDGRYGGIWNKMKVRVLQDLEAISHEAATIFIAISRNCIASKGSFVVALSGGSTPRRFYTLLTSDSYINKIDWRCVHIFWADERCVPKEHEDSNFGSAFKSFLSKVPLPTGNIHRIKCEKKPEDAAMEYENEIRDFFGKTALPVFDLIILGVGEDGHTASLFPDSIALKEINRLAVSVSTDKGNRVTLTLPVLNNATQVLFLAYGHSKAGILYKILEGENRKAYPAGLVNPMRGSVMWLIDRGAAGRLKKVNLSQ